MTVRSVQGPLRSSVAASFEQPFTGIEFEPSLLDGERLHQDAELLRAPESGPKLTRVTEAQSHAGRLREFLVVHALDDQLGMDVAARFLGMSARSLRRRLSEEGVSYAALADEAQGVVARRMLEDPKRSIQETAYAMGFSDPSAFHRAFRR